MWEDVKLNVKVKLSALWVALMFLYTYADILAFYAPGTLEKVMSGEVGGIRLSEGFLFVMAVWMAVPSLMVVGSLALRANINRWVNIVIGVISLLVLAATFFAGETSGRYAFQAGVEGVLMILIVWQAWSWPKQEGMKVGS